MISKIEKALEEEKTRISKELTKEKVSNSSELENLKIFLTNKMQNNIEFKQGKVSEIELSEILKADSNFVFKQESFIAEIHELKNSKEKDAHDAKSEILLNMENARVEEKIKSKEKILQQYDFHAFVFENLKKKLFR